MADVPDICDVIEGNEMADLPDIDEVAEGNEVMEKRDRPGETTRDAAEGQIQGWLWSEQYRPPRQNDHSLEAEASAREPMRRSRSRGPFGLRSCRL